MNWTMIIPLISLLQLEWQKRDVHHGLSQKSGVQNICTKFYKINEDQLDPTLLPPVS